MASAIHVPRINNNDDEVKLVGLQVEVGSGVTKGQILAQVETDKAVVDIESDADGFVLAVLGELDATLQVGSVLVWIGATQDEKVPVSAEATNAASSASSAPTAKAMALLAEHGIDASKVPASGDRLSAADVQRFIDAGGVHSATPTAAVSANAQAAHSPRIEQTPEVAGELVALKSEEKGMLSTVTWHRDVAVAGYVEVGYDPAPWDDYARTFGQQHSLLLGPLLPLMAWRLVDLASETRRLNATIVGSKRYEYSEINLGFTVQAGDVLYLAVMRNAAALGQLGFVNGLVELQRRAAGHRLGPLETRGTTIGFSSMARWKVSRHIPVLPPHTALMVAHAVNPDASGVLGATYDHRVLNGSEVARVLRQLSQPPKVL